jgi:hypothetical protein
MRVDVLGMKGVLMGEGLISREGIEQKIFIIRGQKVMLDKDLAELYGVATRDLNKAVNRNLERFPDDFMLTLTRKEFTNLMFHFGTSSWGGTRKPPRVFTEHGILMLSSVLNSKRAIQVNLQIMRTFVTLRKILGSHKELLGKIEDMEKKYDKQFKIVFEAIRELISPKEDKPKRRIGFHGP